VAGQPTEADPAKWHRWFAVEANNRAWRLADAEAREIFDAMFRTVPAPLA